MKNSFSLLPYFIFILLFSLPEIMMGQNVGIGVTPPLAKLHINGGLLITGTTGATPVSGAGTRFMWIPAKAAFRAGSVTGIIWDDAYIGNNSFALGTDIQALGESSFATGIYTTAGGAYSTAMGYSTGANGQYCTAMGFMSGASGFSSTSIGNSTYASGDNSTAMGYNTTASGSYTLATGSNTNAAGGWSTAMGANTIASGDYSTATGTGTTASGIYSVAMGINTRASGSSSTAIGFQTKSKSYAGTVVGIYNDSTNAADPLASNSANRLFQIGNGTGNNARSNAMTVLQNGNVGIGVLAPSQQLEVANNITVQNGKGLIRNVDGTQSKKLSSQVTISVNFAAGETKSFTVTWPESFSATPEAYVGNAVGGAGGWAEVIMSLNNVTATGATLYIYNPKTTAVSPNFNVKVIAIGAQ